MEKTNRKRLCCHILAMCCVLGNLTAQVTGGQHVFGFLSLPGSARISALGGSAIATRDADVALAIANPALLNQAMKGQLSFNHSFLPTGIGHGLASAGFYSSKLNSSFHTSMQYISYGTFDQTDIYGNVTGSFKANEYALSVGIGRELYERVSLGANIKAVYSLFESYESTAIAGDLAAVFHDTASNTNIALVMRNFGKQLSTYNGISEDLPYEMQLGFSKKLRYLPFRFSVIYQYLNSWNIRYDDPEAEEDIFFFGENTGGGNEFLDNLARHFVVNGEFLFGRAENFRLRFGYNHLKRKELSVNNLRSLTGFSFGFGLKVNRFRIEYGRGFTHLGAGTNHLSISSNLQEFF